MNPADVLVGMYTLGFVAGWTVVFFIWKKRFKTTPEIITPIQAFLTTLIQSVAFIVVMSAVSFGGLLVIYRQFILFALEGLLALYPFLFVLGLTPIALINARYFLPLYYRFTAPIALLRSLILLIAVCAILFGTGIKVRSWSEILAYNFAKITGSEYACKLLLDKSLWNTASERECVRLANPILSQELADACMFVPEGEARVSCLLQRTRSAFLYGGSEIVIECTVYRPYQRLYDECLLLQQILQIRDRGDSAACNTLAVSRTNIFTASVGFNLCAGQFPGSTEWRIACQNIHNQMNGHLPLAKDDAIGARCYFAPTNNIAVDEGFKDQDTLIPLWFFAVPRWGHFIQKELAAASIDVTEKDSRGRGVLSHVVSSYQNQPSDTLESVQALLNAGADPFVPEVDEIIRNLQVSKTVGQNKKLYLSVFKTIQELLVVGQRDYSIESENKGAYQYRKYESVGKSFKLEIPIESTVEVNIAGPTPEHKRYEIKADYPEKDSSNLKNFPFFTIYVHPLLKTVDNKEGEGAACVEETKEHRADYYYFKGDTDLSLLNRTGPVAWKEQSAGPDRQDLGIALFAQNSTCYVLVASLHVLPYEKGHRDVDRAVTSFSF